MKSLFNESPTMPDLSAVPENPTPEQAELIAGQIVEFLRQSVPAAVLKAIPLAISRTEIMPGRLREILVWWNGLADRKLVPHKVRIEKPSAEILEAWKVFQDNLTAQECLADLKRVESEIEKSELVRQGWFRLEKLLRGATNSGRIPICRVLIDGGYRGERSGFNRRSTGDPSAFTSPDDAPVDDWYAKHAGQ